MWRGHNREPVLEDLEDKRAYCRHLGATYTDEVKAKVEAFSISLMNNHVHETGAVRRDENDDLAPSIDMLGNWMRNAHGRFGAEFNRRHHRQGKVAYDRPKTKEIDSEDGVLQVMFYGDANPMRAGMVSHPSQYSYSSYRLYAYGEQSELTNHLVPPPAYLALGRTPGERQRKYRQLCDIYLRNAGLIDDRPSEETDERPAESERRSPMRMERIEREAPLRARTGSDRRRE